MNLKSILLSATTKALELHAFMVFSALMIFAHYVPGARWYGMAVAVAFAAWKEFWFDPRYENAPIKWSGVIDFTGYVTGFVMAAAIWLT